MSAGIIDACYFIRLLAELEGFCGECFYSLCHFTLHLSCFTKFYKFVAVCMFVSFPVGLGIACRTCHMLDKSSASELCNIAIIPPFGRLGEEDCLCSMSVWAIVLEVPISNNKKPFVNQKLRSLV